MSTQRAAMLANLASQLNQMQSEGRAANYNLAMFGAQMKHQRESQDMAKQLQDKQLEMNDMQIAETKRAQEVRNIQNEIGALVSNLSTSLGNSLDNATEKFDLIGRAVGSLVGEKYVKTNSPYASEARMLADQARKEGELKYVQDLLSSVNADAVENGIENNPESLRKFIRRKYGKDKANELLALATRVSGENNQLPTLTGKNSGLFEKATAALAGGSVLSALGVTGTTGMMGGVAGAAGIAAAAGAPTLGEAAGRKIGEKIGEDSDNPDAWMYAGGAVGAAGSTVGSTLALKAMTKVGTKEAWKKIAPLVAKRVATRFGATQAAAGVSTATGVGILAVPLIEAAGAAWTAYDVYKLWQELHGDN